MDIFQDRNPLSLWVTALAPGKKRVCMAGQARIEYPPQVKEAAVIGFCSKAGSAEEVARRHGVLPLLLEESDTRRGLRGAEGPVYPEDIGSLRREADELRKKVRHLRLEKEGLEKAAKIVKKGKGISPDTLTNREKAMVTDAL